MRWLAALVTAAGIVARLAYLHAHTHGAWGNLHNPDEKLYYLDAARMIADQGLSFFLTERSLWNGPGNSVWILLWGCHVPAVKVANIALASLTALLAWDVARRKAGELAGFAALVLCTVHLPSLESSTTIMSEPPFSFLVMLSFWVFDRGGGRKRAALCSGVVMGLACLVRPTVQLWPVAACGGTLLLACCKRGVASAAKPHPHGLRAHASLLAGFVVVVAPYLLKNAIVFRQPIVANGFGAVLYLGNDFRKAGDEPVYVGMSFDTWELTAPHSHLDSEGDRLLRAAALANVRAHPLEALRLFFVKIWRYLGGTPIAFFYPYRDAVSAWSGLGARSVLVALLFHLCTALVAMTWGIIGLARERRDMSAYFAGTLVAYMTVLHASAFAIPRLALPIFPLLSVYAGTTLAHIIHAPRSRPVGRTAMVLQIAAVPVFALAVCAWDAFTPSSIVASNYETLFLTRRELPALASWKPHDMAVDEAGRIVPSGAAPYLEAGIDPVVAQPNQVVLLRLAASARDGRAARRVAWLSWGSGSAGSGDGREPFEILVDGRAHDYRISPSLSPRWQGRIDQLRLDLPGPREEIAYEPGRIVLVR